MDCNYPFPSTDQPNCCSTWNIFKHDPATGRNIICNDRVEVRIIWTPTRMDCMWSSIKLSVTCWYTWPMHKLRHWCWISFMTHSWAWLTHICIYFHLLYLPPLPLHRQESRPPPSTLINVIILPVVVALRGLLLCPLFVFDEKDGNDNDDHVPSIIVVVKNVVSRHSKFTANPSADTKGGVRQPS